MSEVTTTKTRNGFTVEDITFKGARRQSEIDKEISGEDGVSNKGIAVPVSTTPEQVKNFFRGLKERTQNMQERKIYDLTISWIDELAETKKKLHNLESKEVVVNDDGSAEDIEE